MAANEQSLQFVFGLEGADQIVKALQQISAQGNKTFNDLRNAADKIGGKSLVNFVDAARTRFLALQTAGGNLGRSLGDLGNAATSAIRRFTGLAAAIGLSATAVGLFITRTNQNAIEIGRQAALLGTSAEKYSVLAAAAKTADISGEELSGILNRQSKALSDFVPSAAKGAQSMEQFAAASKSAGAELRVIAVSTSEFDKAMEKSGGAVRRLGQEFTQAGKVVTQASSQLDKNKETILSIGTAAIKAGGDAVDAFKAMLKGLTQIPAGTDRAAAAMAIWGKQSGARVNELANDFEALQKQVEKFAKLSDEAVVRAGELDAQLDLLGIAAKGFGEHLLDAFRPLLTNVLGKLNKVLSANFASFDKFATQLASRVQPRIEAFVDALFTNLPQGTALEDTLDDLIQSVTEFGRAVTVAINQIIIPAFNALVSVANGVAAVLNTVFGTEISGKALLIGGTVLQLLGVLRLATTTARAAGAAFTFLWTAIFRRTIAASLLRVVTAVTPLGRALQILVIVLGALGGSALLSRLLGFFSETSDGAKELGRDVANAASATKRGVNDIQTAVAAANARGAHLKVVSASDIQKQFAEAKAEVDKGIKALSDSAQGNFDWSKVFEQHGALGVIEETFGQLADYIIKQIDKLTGKLDGKHFDLGKLLFGTQGSILSNTVKTLNDKIKAAFLSVETTIDESVTALETFIHGPANIISKLIGGLFNLFTPSAANAAEASAPGAPNAAGPFSGLVEQATTAFAAVQAAVKAGEQAVVSEINAFGTGVQQAVASALQPISDGVKATLSAALNSGVVEAFAAAEQAIVASINALGTAIQQGVANAVNGLAGAFSSFASSAVASINSVIASINSLIGRVNAAISALRQLHAEQASSSGGGPGLARGGYIRGPGSSTSDSIPAWLSTGEFVINARAVRKFGLALFAALNRGHLPKNFPKFASGGLVGSLSGLLSGVIPRAIPLSPAAATGVSTARPVNVNIGTETFFMMAPERTIDSLQNFANRRTMVAAGRKPMWAGR